jgi:hypothetical protein
LTPNSHPPQAEPTANYSTGKLTQAFAVAFKKSTQPGQAVRNESAMTKQKASVIALELLLVALALMAVSWAAGLLDSLN